MLGHSAISEQAISEFSEAVVIIGSLILFILCAEMSGCMQRDFAAGFQRS